MAALSHLALLMIYISLSVAPSGTSDVEIRFSPFEVMKLSRDAEGWWHRVDDTGKKVFFKCIGTSLEAGFDIQKTEKIELAQTYMISGKEDWTKPLRISPKNTSKETIYTFPESDRILFRIVANDEDAQEVLTVWKGIQNQP